MIPLTVKYALNSVASFQSPPKRPYIHFNMNIKYPKIRLFHLQKRGFANVLPSRQKEDNYIHGYK